uniref:Complex I-B17 n=1 Tax=Ascaris lumbricoides TaxID=6252 RepID=A0A0M3IQ94_ASCLU
MSLVKNLKAISSGAPRAVISWDRAERIRRNKEIWDNKESIVHRLPLHYQKRYWENILREAAPVHYRPPTNRYCWDTKRLVMHENEQSLLLGYEKARHA